MLVFYVNTKFIWINFLDEFFQIITSVKYYFLVVSNHLYQIDTNRKFEQLFW